MVMIVKKILLLLMLLGCMAGKAVKPQYQKEDSLRVVALLNEGKQQPSHTSLAVFFARKFIGIPYVGHTLDRNKDEQLVVNLRELDCTTYIENVVALTLCVQHHHYTFDEFCKTLADVRYLNGEVDYAKRQHYFTLWIDNNTKMGMVKEVQSPNPPFKALQTISVNYMSSNSNSYDMLRNHPDRVQQIRHLEQSINGRHYRYIPKASIANTKLMRSTVHDGDIIAIVTNKRGLDTSHIGMAVWHTDGLHMLNASSVHDEVVEENMTLFNYMKKHPSQTGIRIIRIL
jgi:hypothetical protein